MGIGKRKTHARRRAVQRCGISLSVQEHDRIVRSIQRKTQDVRFVARISHRYTQYLVSIQGEECQVIYDNALKSLRTVKTPDMW